MLYLFKIIFSYANHFNGWTYNDFYLAFLVFISINFILEMLSDSMYEFFEKLFSGKIDAFFCKPLSLYFIVFFSFLKPSKFLISLIFTSYLYYYLFKNNLISNFMDFFIFTSSFTISIIINICFTFIFHSLNLLSDKNLYIGYFQYQIMQLCFIPPNVYSTKMFNFLFLIFPIILSSALPVLILIHKKLNILLYSFIPLMIMIIFSLYILKNYKKYIKSFGG